MRGLKGSDGLCVTTHFRVTSAHCKGGGLPPSLAPLVRNPFVAPRRGRACPALHLAITAHVSYCSVGRGLDPSAASRRRSLAPTKKSPPSGCGSGWGLGVSVCVRRNHVPELRLRLRNPVPIYYRITAKKLCFSYEQFVNYRAAGPNAPAAPFFVCIWKRCKGSWRE